MSPAEFQQFNRQSAQLRSDLFGVLASYEGGSAFPIALSGVVSRKMLKNAGFQYEHDCIARVQRFEGVSFELGKKFYVPATGKTLRIAEIVDHPINPEWRLGLKQE